MSKTTIGINFEIGSKFGKCRKLQVAIRCMFIKIAIESSNIQYRQNDDRSALYGEAAITWGVVGSVILPC